jgi:SOS-response transcriptional repressor LexA
MNELICPHCGEGIGQEIIGLTEQQRRTMTFIKRHMKANGTAPSYQQIAEALNLKSKSGVFRLVHALVERGALTTRQHRARVLAPTPLGLASIDGAPPA